MVRNDLRAKQIINFTEKRKIILNLSLNFFKKYKIKKYRYLYD